MIDLLIIQFNKDQHTFNRWLERSLKRLVNLLFTRIKHLLLAIWRRSRILVVKRLTNWEGLIVATQTKCPCCGKTFNLLTELLDHVKIKHSAVEVMKSITGDTDIERSQDQIAFV